MVRYYVAGHRGMVGSAILRKLQSRGDEIVTAERAGLDLTNQAATYQFMRSEKPDVVILAAAKVGGILANASAPASFIYENLIIEANVIHAAFRAGVERLLFLGSSCIYPRAAKQPISEDELLTGPLEPTNEPYAVAKIAGVKLCDSYNRQYGTDYRCIMPTNLYGPGDSFHSFNSHVLPGLLRRFHDATLDGVKEVLVWGTGRPRREFMHVDDMADASLFLMEVSRNDYDASTPSYLNHINVGTGSDISIADLATMISGVTGFQGQIRFDTSRPDGTPRKLLDVSRLTALGWKAKIDLKHGIADTYKWFRKNSSCLRQ